jgi:hypothetical protein
MYSSSPAAQQIGTAIDAIAGQSNRYDPQGRLQFKRTTADEIRNIMGFRNIKESIDSIEYNKIMAMNDSFDGKKDEIATLVASGMIVEARQKILQWNAMFPEMPLPTDVRLLMKDPSIGRRVKRKIDDRTMDTRQRRMKKVNDDLADYLVNREGFNMEDLK